MSGPPRLPIHTSPHFPYHAYPTCASTSDAGLHRLLSNEATAPLIIRLAMAGRASTIDESALRGTGEGVRCRERVRGERGGKG